MWIWTWALRLSAFFDVPRLTPLCFGLKFRENFSRRSCRTGRRVVWMAGVKNWAVRGRRGPGQPISIPGCRAEAWHPPSNPNFQIFHKRPEIFQPTDFLPHPSISTPPPFDLGFWRRLERRVFRGVTFRANHTATFFNFSTRNFYKRPKCLRRKNRLMGLMQNQVRDFHLFVNLNQSKIWLT